MLSAICVLSIFDFFGFAQVAFSGRVRHYLRMSVITFFVGCAILPHQASPSHLTTCAQATREHSNGPSA